MGHAIIVLLTTTSFLFGAKMALRESGHLTRHYRHLEEIVMADMLKDPNIKEIDMVTFRHTVDSLHAFELIKLGYMRPKPSHVDNLLLFKRAKIYSKLETIRQRKL